MADNRMYIKCTKCGEEKMFAKYYANPEVGWYFRCISDGENSPDERVFNEWIDEHRHDNYSMNGPTHFTIEFEHRGI